MTRKFLTLFLATFALSVNVQATTPILNSDSNATLATALSAEDSEEEDEGLFWWSAGANLASNYLWRGYDQSYTGNMFDLSVQPSVTLGLGAFYLDLWFNYSTMSQYQEFDMTLGFEYKGLAITVYDVWCGVGKEFWQNNFLDGSNHNLTATIDYTFFDRLRLHWATTFIHSADFIDESSFKGSIYDVAKRPLKEGESRRAFSSYFEIAYRQPIKNLFDIEITAGASPWTGPFWCAGPRTLLDGAYTLDFDNIPKGFNVTNLSLMFNKEFEVGRMTIPLNVGYVYNPTSNRHFALLKAGVSF